MNLRFAHAVADEAERSAGRIMAWIQDYHFALVPEFLRAMRPNLCIHQFLHIPFPPPDILRLLPSGSHEALLRGLPEATRNVIRRLATLPRVTLALVSGRSAADAWTLAGVEGAWVIGNHGLELRTPSGQLSADDEVRQFESAVAAAARSLSSGIGWHPAHSSKTSAGR